MKKFVLLAFMISLVFISMETNAQENIKEEFNKKRIIYFGDSITEGSANNRISWVQYIDKINKFDKSNNSSRSGAILECWILPFII